MQVTGEELMSIEQKNVRLFAISSSVASLLLFSALIMPRLTAESLQREAVQSQLPDSTMQEKSPSGGRAELGVVAAPSPGPGILVEAVLLGSPAELAGIQSGDFIMSIDDQGFSTPKEFYQTLELKQPSTQSKLVVWRSEIEFQVNIELVLAELAVIPERQAWIGMVLDMESLGPPTVRQVLPESPAARAGLKPQDIVLRFNGQALSSTRKLVELIEQLPAYSKVSLTVRRDGVEKKLDMIATSRIAAPWGWRHQAFQRLQDDLRWHIDNLPYQDHYEQRFQGWEQDLHETVQKLRREVQRLREELTSKTKELLKGRGEGNERPGNDAADKSIKISTGYQATAADPIIVSHSGRYVRTQPMLPNASVQTSAKTDASTAHGRFQYYGDYYQVARRPPHSHRSFRQPYRVHFPQQARPYYYYHFYPGDVYYGRLLYDDDPRLDILQRAYLWSDRTY